MRGHQLNSESATLDSNADRIVAEIGIPPCPAILTKLLRETRAEEPDFRRVGQFVGGDVALASAVLNVANSPFYGLRTQAASVQQALALLGLNTVTPLVTRPLLRQAFASAAGPHIERYWKSSMATALISTLVCRETGRADSGIACTYGLFRDCGMPVMLQKYLIYADIFDGSALTPGEPVLEVENERYATNHARVGAQMARSWHLPESLCCAILNQHDVPYSEEVLAQVAPDARTLIAIGLAAEQIYRAAIGAAHLEWALAGDWALIELGLSWERLAELSVRVKASINHL
jgi:HD-like signal output (HDOD) protein